MAGFNNIIGSIIVDIGKLTKNKPESLGYELKPSGISMAV